MIERGITGKSDTQNFVERKLVRSEEFPSDPEERLAAVLAGFANSEAKTTTLLLLGDYPKTGYYLRKEFLEATDNCWAINKECLREHCHYSLVPIGMVAEELFLSMGALEFALGYAATEAGENYGKPIAAFLLHKAVEYGSSFFPIFGPTTSPSTSRAPSNRVKILAVLVQNPGPLRTTDVNNLLGIGDTIRTGRHLRALDKAGLISYSVVDTEKSGYACFQWQPGKNPEEVIGPEDYRLLTFKIAQILALERRPMNHEDLQEALQQRFPGRIYRLNGISTVLNSLLDHGFATAQFRGKKQSEIILLEEGKRFHDQVILPIKDALEDGPALAEMRARMTGWRTFAPKAVSLYKEASPYAQREPKAVWLRRIVELLYLHPHGLRPKEVSSSFENLSQARTKGYLSELYRLGLVEKTKTGPAVYYYLPTLSQSS